MKKVSLFGKEGMLIVAAIEDLAKATTMRLFALTAILALLSDLPAPYLDCSKAGAGFYGSERELPEPEGLRSIESAGLNRARIRDAMSQSSFQGLTGKIAFNQLGGNDGQPVVMILQAGQWETLE
jgi:hypothetical protein